MLTANQIYKAHVEQYGTPFHIWLNSEKQEFNKRNRINADDKKKKFDNFLNSRYSHAPKGFWKKKLELNVNGMGAQDGDIFEDAMRKTMNDVNLQYKVEPIIQTETETEPIIKTETESKLLPKDFTKSKNKTLKTKPVNVPFLKRKIIGIKVSTALISIGVLSVLIATTVAIVNHNKKNNNRK